MRTIIAGSRTFTDPAIIVQAIEQAAFSISCVLCGDAEGVDQLGAEWAEAQNLPVQHYPADWSRYGRRAGPMRNRAMVEQADALIAVWDGQSAGTADVIKRSVDCRLRVFVKTVG